MQTNDSFNSCAEPLRKTYETGLFGVTRLNSMKLHEEEMYVRLYTRICSSAQSVAGFEINGSPASSFRINFSELQGFASCYWFFL